MINGNNTGNCWYSSPVPIPLTRWNVLTSSIDHTIVWRTYAMGLEFWWKCNTLHLFLVVTLILNSKRNISNEKNNSEHVYIIYYLNVDGHTVRVELIYWHVTFFGYCMLNTELVRKIWHFFHWIILKKGDESLDQMIH